MTISPQSRSSATSTSNLKRGPRGLSGAPVRILLIEDMPVTAQVVQGYLRAVSPQASVEWADTLGKGIALLEGGGFDLILADLNLPDSNGLETLDRLLAATDRLVVVLTSEDEQTFHDAALERGVYDFLHKSKLNKATLGQVVRLATIQAETFRSLWQTIAERELQQRRLERLTRVHAVLSGINALIVRARSREEVFREACRVAVEAGGFRVAWIGMVDLETQRITPAAWQGPGRELLEGLRLEIGDGTESRGTAFGQAVRERRAVVLNDIEHDERIVLRREMTELGMRSMAVLPLVAGGEAVGALTLVSEEVGLFDEEETKLLADLAGDLSYALEHIEKAQQLDYLALYDPVTDLANRRLLLERLGRSIHAAAQAGAKFPLVLADIDRFRAVNESLGRPAGDALLKQAAERLARAAGPDEVGRAGPDQFGVVLRSVLGRTEAGRNVQTLLRECFAEPFIVDGKQVGASAKAGIALFPNDGKDAETLLKHAEAALRRSKDSGERFVFYNRSFTQWTAETLSLENKLRQALKHGEFVLHYQPKIDAMTREIAGVEALIRWRNPDLGLVPPGRFIPLMEETGLILEAGAWALRQAAADHRRLQEMKLPAPRVAVNVSAIQLRRRDFVDMIAEATGDAATAGIDLEITESLVMQDIEGNIRKLRELCERGMSIAIDDFGTGYSSLAYLARLPVQSLKIDRSFVVTMLLESTTMTLVQTIISLARSLKLKVVAEGVEAEDQAKVLGLLRCDELQGFLFSRPLPFTELCALLARSAGGSVGGSPAAS